MTNAHLKLLSDIFSDPLLAAQEELDNELENLGFSYEEFSSRVLNGIKDLKRNTLYDEGKQKINSFYNLLNGLKEKLQTESTNSELEKEIRFAFNKLDDLTEEDIKEIMDDQRKMLLLKEIVNKKDNQE